MIVDLDKKRLGEIFEKTIDPSLLYEELDIDYDTVSGSTVDHTHTHDHGVSPLQP